MKRRKIVATVIILVLAVADLVASFIIGIKLCPFEGFKKYFISFLLALVGISGAYIVHSTLHELGHLLVAKACKCKITEFSLFGFVMKNGKVSFKPFSEYSGYVSYTPTTTDKGKIEKIFFSTLHGGLVGSLLASVWPLFCVLIDVNNYYLYYIFCVGGAILIYTVFINWFSFIPGTDGYYIFSQSQNATKLTLSNVRALTYQAHMLNGKSAVEINLEETENICYFDILKALETKDYDTAKRLVSLIKEQSFLPDNQLIAPLLEEFYISLKLYDAENKSDIESKYSMLCRYLSEDDDDPAVLRIIAEYHYVNCEKDWANAIEHTFEKACDNCVLTGYAKTQRNIRSA